VPPLAAMAARQKDSAMKMNRRKLLKTVGAA
jgi:hypothetical protein